MSERVFITGLGVVSPLGSEVSEVWAALLAGRSGVGPITLFDASALPVRIGGEARGFRSDVVSAEFGDVARETDRKVWLGLQAALAATRSAGLAPGEFGGAGLFIGVSLEMLALEVVAAGAQAPDFPAALSRTVLAAGRVVQTPLDRLADRLAARYGIRGGCWTNCSACAAGAQAIGEAFRRLRDGELELALAGATDSALHPLGLGGFGLLRILAPENERPQQACRPFDATRAGTVLSEGAALVVLETAARARRRRVEPIAEVLGYGSSLDAYRVSDPAPDGRGAWLSMTRALADAGREPGEIGCINAHGTGTPKNDVVEAQAIRRLLGDRGERVPVHAVKSMTGHMIATSGAFEAVVAALALRHRMIPPTINLAQPDPECALDHVANVARALDGDVVLSNSFGFGGQNASLLLRRFCP